MSKFNAWGIHHWHWGTIANAIAATLLFAWYFGDRNPWCGGYGVTFLAFGLWVWIDDFLQHRRQRRGLVRCPKCKGTGEVYFLEIKNCPACQGHGGRIYRSWVHKRYNKDAERFGVWGAVAVYLALLMGTGLVATGAFLIGGKL